MRAVTVEHAALVVGPSRATYEPSAKSVSATITEQAGNPCRLPRRLVCRDPSRARSDSHESQRGHHICRSRTRDASVAARGGMRRDSLTPTAKGAIPPTRCALTTTRFSNQLTVHLPASPKWITPASQVAQRSRSGVRPAQSTPSRCPPRREAQHRRPGVLRFSRAQSTQPTLARRRHGRQCAPSRRVAIKSSHGTHPTRARAKGGEELLRQSVPRPARIVEVRLPRSRCLLHRQAARP